VGSLDLRPVVDTAAFRFTHAQSAIALEVKLLGKILGRSLGGTLPPRGVCCP
jgi:hypothetical protein